LFGGAQSGEFAALIDGHPTLAGSEVAAKEGYSEVAGVPVAYKIAPSFPVSRGSHRVRGPFRLRFTYATPVLVKKLGMEMPGMTALDRRDVAPRLPRRHHHGRGGIRLAGDGGGVGAVNAFCLVVLCTPPWHHCHKQNFNLD
jgi:hypothetical protein